MAPHKVACALFGAFLTTTPVAAESASVRVAPFGRADELWWHIAGGVNILSELTWSDLAVVGLEVEASAAPVGSIEVRGRARAGWILSGENQDSDYGADDRHDEWSRSNNDGSGGLVWDASAAVGYRFGRTSGRLSVLSLYGLEIAQERLCMTDGEQTISVAHDPQPPPTGPFAGLDSRYVATWWGPWIGGEALYSFPGGTSARLFFGYQFVAYYAWADWNLRTDFDHPKSFEHRAWGHAFRAAAEIDVPVSPRTQLSIRGDLALGSVGPGADRTFESDETVSYTQLNGVWWRSFGGSAGLRYRLR